MIPKSLSPAVCALAWLALSAPQVEAQKKWILQLDCHSTRDINNRGSGGLLTVEFLDSERRPTRSDWGQNTASGKLWGESAFHRSIPDGDCALGFASTLEQIGTFGQADVIAWEFEYYDGADPSPRYIQIRTDSNDAFWLDRLIMDDGYGNGARWGVNEGRGYCLSRESGDANGSWRSYVDQCAPCWEFEIASDNTAAGSRAQCPAPTPPREVILPEPPRPSPGPGSPVSLRSDNYPDRYIRHVGGDGVIEAASIEAERASATFVLAPGLADNAGGVSFRSASDGNRYLRHRNHELHLDPRDGSHLFDQDATFRQVPGLAGSGVSFESLNFPGYYIRHSGFRLYIGQSDGSALFNSDATFHIESPLGR